MKKPKLRQQYAALPLRIRPDGQPEILLVTSRGRQRWIIPKGWPMRGQSAAEAAAQEAYEEAGVVGDIGDAPIGSYQYEKRLTSGHVAQIEVSIFLLQVRSQLDAWPEQAQRQACWFGVPEAADKVEEPGLADILRGIEAPAAAIL